MNGEAHIISIAVDPICRGRGWGEVLLVSMLGRGIGMGADYGTLEVRVSNEAAINLYKKYDYQVVGRKENYYHNDDEDALEMATRPFDAGLCYAV